MTRGAGGSRDPGGHARRRAARVTVVGLVVFVALGWVVDLPEAAGPAFFAVFTLGAMADFGGTRTRRALRYVLTGGVGLAMLALSTALVGDDALVVATTGVVAFAVLFLGTLGGPFYSARFPIVIAFLYGATTTASGDAVAQRLVGWTVGTLAITLASLVLWPAHDLSEVPSLVADVLRRAARVLTRPDIAPARDRLVEASHRVRIAANAEHLHAGAVAGDERLRAELVHATERLAAVCATVLPSQLTPIDRALVATTADALTTCADALATGAPAGAATLDAALESHAATMADELAATAHDPAAAAVTVATDLTATDVRIVTRLALTVATLVDTAHGGAPPVGVAAADMVDDRPETALRAQLRLRSLWFRNALRAAVALSVAMALVLHGVGHDHGFWVALGAFTVLRADLATIGRSAWATMVGTTIGFAVSSSIVAVSEPVHGMLWVGFVVALFVAGLGDRVRPEIGAAAFTTLVVCLYTLVEPAGLRTGELRLVNVAIGVGVTLGVTLLLWPRPGRAPRRMVAEVVDRARAGLAGTVAGRPPAEPMAVVGEIDRVLDVISTSAPRTLTDRDRARVLTTVDLTATLTQYLGDPAASSAPALASVTTSPHLRPALEADAATIDVGLHRMVAELAHRTVPAPSAPPDALTTRIAADLAGATTHDATLLTAATRVASALALIDRVAQRRAPSRPLQPTRTGTSE